MSAFATTPLRRPLAAASTLSPAQSLPLAIVLGAITFNLVLCFLNGRLLSVSNLHVAACEALLISAAFFSARHILRTEHVLLLAAIVLFTFALASLRVALGFEASLNVKIVRDLIIPVVFFLLGLRVNDVGRADTLVRIAVAIVLAFALFEYFSVEAFTEYFNVARYYIARGTMEAKEAMQSGDLFISGVRPAGIQGGRNLLPFLGDHRVSSVFLEPVSMGNFGMIIFLWGLVRSKFGERLHLGLMAAGLAFVVLADSRFGAYFCLMGLAIMFAPPRLAAAGVAAMPIFALAVLLFVPFFVTGSYDPQRRYIDNGFVGRLVLSAQILSEFGTLHWFGLKSLSRTTFDSGYAYILEGIGALGVVGAWVILMTLSGRTKAFYAFRNVAATYYAVILCISNSPFTIKTAALLWFLLGVLAQAPERSGAALRLTPRASAIPRGTAAAKWRARRIPPPRMRA